MHNASCLYRTSRITGDSLLSGDAAFRERMRLVRTVPQRRKHTATHSSAVNAPCAYSRSNNSEIMCAERYSPLKKSIDGSIHKPFHLWIRIGQRSLVVAKQYAQLGQISKNKRRNDQQIAAVHCNDMRANTQCGHGPIRLLGGRAEVLRGKADA